MNLRIQSSELEEFLFFSVAVAGKTSRITRPAVRRFFAESELMPFEYLRRLNSAGMLELKLREHKLGQYTKLVKFSVHILANPVDLRVVSVQSLEEMPGIGPKTARFFVAYSRPAERHAILDTHVLAWLRERGHTVPRATPQSRKEYARIETIFLKCAEQAGVPPVELDDQIWNERSWRPKPKGNQDG